MTRRKSRPLLPHEIISNFYSDQCPSTAPSSSICTNDSSLPWERTSQSSTYSSQTTQDSHLGTGTSVTAIDAKVDNHESPSATSTSIESHDAGPKAEEISNDPENTTDLLCPSDKIIKEPQDHSIFTVDSLSQTFSNKPNLGYFANRRSAPFMVDDEQAKTAPSPALDKPIQGSPEEKLLKPSKPLQRTSSLVRLSLSLDGKAEVTTRSGNTPSPPRYKHELVDGVNPRPHAGLQRSYSALEPGIKPAQGPSPALFPKRSMAGRSRDARTWEFYCDIDARNALTEQAAREVSGSATAAISLMRSHSQNNKAMTPNTNKRNAHIQKPEFTKRLKAEVSKSGKPKLARATSSIVRLQTTEVNHQQHVAVKQNHKKSMSGSQTSIYEDNGDSDKENWEPGTQTRNPRRCRPINPTQCARILGENQFVPSQSTSLDTLMHRESREISRSSTKDSSSETKENISPDVDDELAALMRKPGTREVEDLDCVQQLLSLSQAVWQ